MTNFIVDNQCPYCNSTKFYAITKDKSSDVVCSKCAAIFSNPTLMDKDIAGRFTGRYSQLKSSSLIEFSFAKKNKKENK